MMRRLFIFLAFASVYIHTAAAIECPDPRLAADLPASHRKWFRNPDGSCVQCSIGMCGVDQNNGNAASLLWDTDYGPKERGGSWPSRVAEYARRRGIKLFNVTGKNTTMHWMRWACITGRPAAIGAGTAHFQTLFGHHDGTWFVCNNNSTHRIDEYGEQAFVRLHLASGPWVVILDAPPHPARPVYRQWWLVSRPS